MKKLLIAVLFVMLAIPVSASAWSESSFDVGFAGTNGYRGGGNAFSIGYSQTTVRHGGHRGYDNRHYRGNRHYRSYHRVRHIYRQEGRVYYQDSYGMPVVVVPSGYRQYRGCGCCCY